MTTTLAFASRRIACASVLAIAVAAPVHAQSQEAPPTEAPSFLSLFTKLPDDVKHLFTVGNAMTLGIGGASAFAVHQKDDEIARRSQTWASLDDALSAGTVIGDGGVQAGFGLGVYLVGRFTDHARTAHIGADLVRAQIINALITDGLKPIADRTRPDGGDYSFPSGHTSSVFATAAVLQRRIGWKAGIPAYAMASYVGLSRLTDHKHYPSDIIFGATVGILSGRATTFHQYGGTVQITPQASARMAGIIVGWTADGR
jgi:membrane-associated phospholipid phosphatase